MSKIAVAKILAG